MAGQHEKSNEDLRFILEEIPLKRSPGDDENAPPSTICDTAVSTISPDFRGKVAAREARNQEVSTPKVDQIGQNYPFHPLSPDVVTSKKPFELDVSGNKIKVSDEIQDDESDLENEMCCCGLVSLHPTVFALNVITVFVGLVSIGTASYQVRISVKAITGFSSLGNLVVSGVYLSASACIFLGVLFCISGIIGCILSYSRWRALEPQRWLDVIGQCSALLLSILSLAMVVINAVALVKANRANLYDSLKWATVVQAEPSYSCQTEMRLNCAGFAAGNCVLGGSDASNSFCPGHFCINFCKAATDAASDQKVCDPCRQGGDGEVSEFLRCKAFEKAVSEQKGCNLLLNRDLRESYQGLLGVSVIELLSMTTLILFSQTCSA